MIQIILENNSRNYLNGRQVSFVKFFFDWLLNESFIR